MVKASPAALAGLLQRPILRLRTGILLLPSNMVGHEPELAARLGLGKVDWREWKLRQLGPDSRYLGLSHEGIVRDLGQMAEDGNISGTCLWVYNADLFVSALRYEERRYLWSFLHSTFRPPRGVMVSLPAEATNLLAPEERMAWARDERLAEWEGA